MVENEITGVWQKFGGWYRCSECVHMPDEDNITNVPVCPNCGARMTAYEIYDYDNKVYRLEEM